MKTKNVFRELEQLNLKFLQSPSRENAQRFITAFRAIEDAGMGARLLDSERNRFVEALSIGLPR